MCRFTSCLLFNSFSAKEYQVPTAEWGGSRAEEGSERRRSKGWSVGSLVAPVGLRGPDRTRRLTTSVKGWPARSRERERDLLFQSLDRSREREREYELPSVES